MAKANSPPNGYVVLADSCRAVWSLVRRDVRGAQMSDTESELMREYRAAVWPDLRAITTPDCVNRGEACAAWQTMADQWRLARTQYDKLYAAAKLVADNYEVYGSPIKVTVPMALVDALQKVLKPLPSSGNGGTK
jgi:hypothetical protein